MTTAYVVSGQVTADGKIELDERLPLLPGRVRVSVQAVTEAAPVSSPLEISREEWEKRKADLAAAAGCLSDEDAQRILTVIEAEFEQVDGDDWR